MFDNNKKETDTLFQCLGFNIKIDDLIIMFFLYTLYSERLENSSLFVVLLLLLLT